MRTLSGNIKNKLTYLEGGEAKQDGIGKLEIKYRTHELTLLSIAVSQVLLGNRKTFV